MAGRNPDGTFAPGWKGGPGRPPGSVRKEWATEFLEDFRDAWNEHGANALQHLAINDPGAFVKAAVALCPRQDTVEQNVLEVVSIDFLGYDDHTTLGPDGKVYKITPEGAAVEVEPEDNPSLF